MRNDAWTHSYIHGRVYVDGRICRDICMAAYIRVTECIFGRFARIGFARIVGVSRRRIDSAVGFGKLSRGRRVRYAARGGRVAASNLSIYR